RTSHLELLESTLSPPISEDRLLEERKIPRGRLRKKALLCEISALLHQTSDPKNHVWKNISTLHWDDKAEVEEISGVHKVAIGQLHKYESLVDLHLHSVEISLIHPEEKSQSIVVQQILNLSSS